MRVLDRWFASAGGMAPVLLRLIVGTVAIVHGWPKLKDLGSFIGRVAKLGLPVPEFFATAAALSEFLGGIALVLGFFGRYAALFFGGVMAVAVFRVHWANGFLASNKGFEYPLTLLVCCVSLILTGSGPISVDRLMGRK
jgi:putative oxidoreductase